MVEVKNYVSRMFEESVITSCAELTTKTYYGKFFFLCLVARSNLFNN